MTTRLRNGRKKGAVTSWGQHSLELKREWRGARGVGEWGTGNLQADVIQRTVTLRSS